MAFRVVGGHFSTRKTTHFHQFQRAAVGRIGRVEAEERGLVGRSKCAKVVEPVGAEDVPIGVEQLCLLKFSFFAEHEREVLPMNQHLTIGKENGHRHHPPTSFGQQSGQAFRPVGARLQHVGIAPKTIEFFFLQAQFVLKKEDKPSRNGIASAHIIGIQAQGFDGLQKIGMLIIKPITI